MAITENIFNMNRAGEREREHSSQETCLLFVISPEFVLSDLEVDPVTYPKPVPELESSFLTLGK